jgi:CPA2 family monovalent cation:H+ antiporter-2
LLVVVCVLAAPLLASSPTETRSLWLALPFGVVVMAAILLCGRYVVPVLLYQIVRTRNRELFLIAICVIVIGTATATAWVGMSLALGAFLAGLTLADSEFGHQTMAEVLPFRDTLSSLFFVSMGMLLDVDFLVEHVGLVGVSVAGLVALKFATIAAPTIAAGYPLQVAVLAGLSMAQIGEFSFVLLTTGREYELLTAGDYQTFLAAAVMTMGITPFLFEAGPRLVGLLERMSWLARWFDRPSPEPEPRPEHRYADHVIICGYGLNGRNLAAGLRELQIPYVVLEMNPETVRTRRSEGESILLGDCSRPAVLERAGVRRARTLVVGISDPISTRQTVRVARQASQQVRIIVRTRYRSEVGDLRALGADEIIPEEFETSIEIFARVLREYHVPGNVIRQWIDRIRAEHYEAFRSDHLGREKMLLLADQVAGQAQIENCLLGHDSAAVGRTIAELALRSQAGATVIAVRRGELVHASPGADFRFAAGDIVVLLGEPDQIDRAMELLN